MVDVTYEIRNVRPEYTARASLQFSTFNESQPVVLALADGGFAVAVDIAQVGGGGPGRVLDIYNADGALRFGSVIVDFFTNAGVGTDAAMTQLTGGRLLITWTDNNSTAPMSQPGIHFRIVDPATGQVVGEEARLPQTDAADFASEVVALPGGGWALVKQDGSAAADQDADLVIYDSTGAFVAIQPLNVNSPFDEQQPVIARLINVLDNGNLAIAYEREITDGSDTFEIAVEVFTPSGTRVLNPTAFDTTGTQQRAPEIVALDDGGFAVAYLDSDTGAGDAGASIAFFDAAGALRGSPIRLDTGPSAEAELSVTRLQNGFVFVTFTLSGGNIASALFDPVTTTRVLGFGLIEDQALVQDQSSVGVLANGTVVTAWRDKNAAIEDGNTDPDDDHVSIQIDRIARVVQGTVGADVFSGDDLYDEIQGLDGNDVLAGFGGNDRIFGGDDNDTIDGGGGADTLDGEAGDDIFLIASQADFDGDAIEGGADTDTIRFTSTTAASSLILTNQVTGVEIVEIADATGERSGTTALDLDAADVTSGLTIRGNDGVNVITGTELADIIEGLGGNDTINGGGGDDTIRTTGEGQDRTSNGGEGDDTFVLSNAFFTGNIHGDGGDNDHVDASAYDGFVINVDLAAGTYDDGLLRAMTGIEHVTGGNGNDTFLGSAASNRLIGNAGNDTLDGRGGADTLRGVGGNDIYVIDNLGDTVDESVAGSDGVDTVKSSVVSVNFGDAVHFLGQIEQIILEGSANLNATGNGLANAMVGNAGNNTLDGGANADVLRGLAGNDIYLVDNGGDTVDEAVGGAGTDTVKSSVLSIDLTNTTRFRGAIEQIILEGALNLAATGNGLANAIVGNSGNNTLDGGGNADVLRGLAGNDTYVVDNGGDTVDEAVGGAGVDTVKSSVISIDLTNTTRFRGDIENVTLEGAANLNATGNALANAITGNSGVNLLRGLGGSDNYTIDNAGDIVDEAFAGSGGTDTVFSSTITIDLSNAARFLGSIEQVILQGGANLNAIGNGLNNAIVGNSGNNQIDGRIGSDIMRGLGGNDLYSVDNLGDVVDEAFAGSGGLDTVRTTSVSIDLSNAARFKGDIEQIVLEGGGALNATGNGLANNIVGNSGANLITGGLGLDRTIGNGGADTFVFRDAADSVVGANRDVILDFEDVGDNDTIDLSGFSGVLTFIAGAAFTAANQVRAVVSGADVLIEINTAGVSGAESQILLANTAIGTVDASDFFL